MSGDNAFFPEMQALRKKKKHSIISEPRSADNFSPVLEEFEEDQEVFPCLHFKIICDILEKNQKNQTYRPSERFP